MNYLLCRLCVVKIEPSSHNSIAAINAEIYTKIQMHLNLEVKINDISLSPVCTPCIEKINEFHDYYQRVHENQVKFNEFLNQTKECNISTDFEAVTLKASTNLECHLEDTSNESNLNLKTIKRKCLRKSTRKTKSTTIKNNSTSKTIIKNELEEITTNDPLKSVKNAKKLRSKRKNSVKNIENIDNLDNIKDLEKKIKKRTSSSSSSPPPPPAPLRIVDTKLDISKENLKIESDKNNEEICKNGDDDDDFEFEDSDDLKNEDDDCEEFPKDVVKNGKFLIHGAKLTRYMQKFFVLTCDLCPVKPTNDDRTQNFSNLKSFFAHYKTVHNVKGYVSCCGKKLSRRMMTHHFATHVNPEEYTCKECGLLVTKPQSLKIHMESKHSSDAARKKFPCLLCQRVYKNTKTLKNHQMEKHPSGDQQMTTFQCKDCDKSYNSEHRLQEHIKNVHVDKIHVCHICGKGFRLKGNLKYHQATHEENPSIVQCDVCGKWLKNELIARQHYSRMHTSTVVHKCDLCDYTSLIKRNLKMHLKIKHSDLKPHACPYCDHKFKSRTNLNDHMTRHTGVKTKCEFCSKEFITKSNYFAHRKKVHFEELEKLHKQKELEMISKSMHS